MLYFVRHYWGAIDRRQYVVYLLGGDNMKRQPRSVDYESAYSSVSFSYRACMDLIDYVPVARGVYLGT